MNIVFSVLTVQILLGAFDTLWHHEFKERLPAKRDARSELLLHSLREFIYAGLFLALAWATWYGIWAYALIALFATEVVITVADFLIEDKTRALPALERVLHTVLAINVGVFMTLFVPIALQWSTRESAVIATSYGAWSIFLSVAALGVGIWAVRDASAAIRWFRPEFWRRHPFVIGNNSAPRTILITGATGFIGIALCRALLQRGDKIIVLTRSKEKATDRFGRHVTSVSNLDEINRTTKIDAIVNLAGAPIAGWFWTAARRKTLLQSRIGITQAIVDLIERLACKPSVLISGSAIGYYGTHGEKRLIESDQRGSGFQSELCANWEAATREAAKFGVRICRVRFGLVLGNGAGVLPQLLLPLKLKCNVLFGDGNQWVSWIHINDAVRLLMFAIDTDVLEGAVNATAPRPVTHNDLMLDLGKRRHATVRLRVPARAIRFVLGELSELFVDGQKVAPIAAPALGFKFKYEKLNRALDDLLTEASNAETINVYYDGACPICNSEIQRYRKAREVTSARIAFTNLATTTNVARPLGLNREDARRRLYTRSASGEVKSGVDAMIEIWQRLAAYTWLAKIARLPGIHGVSEVIYDFIAAPLVSTWSARRRGAAPERSNHREATL